jgi:hypothetical protein
MRTLVVGIPLPHVTFDNYSFISAPALSDYQRIIVEMSAVSGAIEEVIAGTREHRDFAGHRVQNGPSTAAAFSLADLLHMRRRETDWFFARGGILVAFAHPDVAHPGVEGICGWRRYSWLPSPTDFRYDVHLQPGFGTPGAEVIDTDYPIASFIAEFASRLAYRVTVDEAAPNFGEYGRVFARRANDGPAIALEFILGGGRLILLPPLLKPESDRAALAHALFTSLERFSSASAAP